MKIRYFENNTYNFSRWTRKAYAIFRSIGKTINIGVLSFDFHKSTFAIFFASITKDLVLELRNNIVDVNIDFIQSQNNNIVLENKFNRLIRD